MNPAPRRIAPLAITAQGLASAAGIGLAPLAKLLRAGGSALTPLTGLPAAPPCWAGRVPGLESAPLPAAWAEWDCRATRLAWQGLRADGFLTAAQAACARHGAGRVGLVLGTSASTIAASEQAYATLDADGSFPPALRSERLNTLHALAAFVQLATGLQGPCVTVSTACSSSAQAFAQAERWLRLDLADAVVVAGVDALCASLFFGFHALGLLAPTPCQPFAAARCGISIAEAAGYALLERGTGPWQLLGWGAANDAHHMSSPHPQGLGAERALDDALARSGLAAEDIDYLNLHGTATPLNDAVEAALVARRYSPGVYASASKGATGHAMGAAGIVEALVCGLALREELGSGSAGTAAVDPALGAVFAGQLRKAPSLCTARVAASHSFGFGGNNAVLIFGGSA
ncbi:3-oxoacyl-(acyl-carrier-protein) synthase, FabV inferred for ABFAE pathway [Rubrivivax sp. A210]|uniref:beta-ketoacyl synthase N-terminal-like domain-containing protein n=1 Tax=Rubrivivax sp. A210 TaxID=2772301 RepID=UPI0019186040|nr:beta-ketoacyl synthase N-terminal-like domain-containing protein [Rubrivivax sp. A210]CAD5372056.1 3-oxoacyl-(acyl-carrier-protein) synthase, FabV inferred for ABFAE pathway [Rubrivivax sp. A210]